MSNRPPSEDPLNDLTDLWNARIQALRPPPRLLVSQWADRYRMLPETAAEPGPWRTSRAPYLRDILDALSPSHPAEWVCLMKGAQLGGSEVGLCWIGYTIHLDPGGMLLVQPTEQMVMTSSYERLNPMIEATPEVRDRVAKARSRSGASSLFRKDFRGGFLRSTAAASPVGLRSSPVPKLFLDEVDAYVGDSGGEGDPVRLAEKRTVTFGGRAKKYMVSTPTIKGRSRIARQYGRSNRQRYFVPCQACGAWDHIRWAQIQWPEGHPEQAGYVCTSCGHKHLEHEKPELLAAGQWRATAKAEEWDGITWGYHLPSMYSPFEAWATLARQFTEATKAGQSELKVFVNTVFAEEWEEQGEAPDWAVLHGRRETYARNSIPDRQVLLLTAGVDVQKDRLEVEIVGWGQDRQSWSIDYRVIMAGTAEAQQTGRTGDTANLDDPAWSELSELLRETWKHPCGVDMQLRALGIDEGYNTQIVRSWGRRQSPRQVLVCKGFDHATAALGRPKQQDINSRGKVITRGVQVWPVGVSHLKGEFYAMLWLEPPTEEARNHGVRYPSGFCHFPEYSEEHFKQLTAEQMRPRVDRGFTKREWHKVHERNEALDCRILARAAAYFSGMEYWKPDQWAQLREHFGCTDAGEPGPDDDPGAGGSPQPPLPRPRRRVRFSAGIR